MTGRGVVMELTACEKALLNGDYGQEAKQLMEVMLKVAEINGATELVEVKNVQIGSTGILAVGGESGINFLGRLADAGIRFRIPAFTNTVSVDINQWQRIGIPREYAEAQLKGIETWARLGAIINCSCMPFICGAIPKLGDHVGYSDTATVIFANSYFGARTNVESDLLTLAAAICGRIPSFGYHLDENRLGQVLVNVKAKLRQETDYDALGYHVGRIVQDKVPVFRNLDENMSTQAFMQLGSALASTGVVPLFHCLGITPEVRQNPYLYGEKNVTAEIEVTDKEVRATYRELNTTTDPKIDLVFIGCPHCTVEKVKYVADVLADRKICKGVEVWISTPGVVRELALRSGDVQRIERTGAKVLSDTCVVLAPTGVLGYRSLATDSAKSRVYMSDFGLNVRFGTTEQCLEAAVKGYWEVNDV